MIDKKFIAIWNKQELTLKFNRINNHNKSLKKLKSPRNRPTHLKLWELKMESLEL